MMASKPKIIVIVGPTGSGKTAWAVALARDLSLRGATEGSDEAIPSGGGDGFELVSADSRQVYRGMDIGTGKEVASDVPHHLIDIVNPDEDFTLADFLDRAKAVIADIHARGRVPVVVGGTGLYVQALVENWQVPNIAPDKKMRAELEKKSVDELRLELAAVDPKEAERLERGKRYLVRALEMWHTTGRKPSALKTKNEPFYDALVIGIDLPREELYRRIDARVDDMFSRGLVDEVRELLKKYPPNLPAFNTIGYRELIGAEECGIFAGEGCLSQAEAAEGDADVLPRRTRPVADVNRLGEFLSQENSASEPLIDRIKYATHAYARRQMTWLRRMKYIVWCRTTEEALTTVRKYGRF